MTDDLFSNKNEDQFQLPPEYDPNVNYVEQLVGEGKKFHAPDEKEAINKLAFSKLESDRFVERLKQEQATLRSDLMARQRLEDLVTRLGTSEQNKQAPSTEDNQDQERMNTVNNQQDFKGMTAEEVTALLDERMRTKANLDRVTNSLKSVYGDNYETVLNAEAKVLNVSKDFVNNLAKTNPDAFIRMFVKDKSQTDMSVSPPTSSVNTSLPSGMTSNGIKTQKFYEDLKKKSPAVYWSPKVQQQEYEDAKKLGPAFFNV